MLDKFSDNMVNNMNNLYEKAKNKKISLKIN